eukprot:2875551-Amphidinium_carterae.1
MVRASMLRRGGASAGVLGSSKAVWKTNLGKSAVPRTQEGKSPWSTLILLRFLRFPTFLDLFGFSNVFKAAG